MDLKDFKARFEKVEVQNHLNKVLQTPKVSVCVQTYQHVNYIKNCLDGILNQQTNFAFEILLGEDASSDGTREICIEYAEKFPDQIRLFLHHRENNIKIKNVATGRFNFLYNLYHCNGKYIAFCEGDDYWTDPFKLQKQVDFLETNPDFELCFTNCNTINAENEILNKSFLNHGKSVFVKEDLLFVAPTLTRVFKNRNFNKVDLTDVLAADAYLLIWQLHKGKAKYIPEITASYRKHVGGIWSLSNELKKATYYFDVRLKAFNIIDEKLYNKFYKLTFIALLKIAILNKDSAKHLLKDFKEKYKTHKITTFKKINMTLCSWLVLTVKSINFNLYKKLMIRLL